jgi:hypothetical protein
LFIQKFQNIHATFMAIFLELNADVPLAAAAGYFVSRIAVRDEVLPSLLDRACWYRTRDAAAHMVTEFPPPQSNLKDRILKALRSYRKVNRKSRALLTEWFFSG